ncbi:tRNA (adenosine(37)-N6)-threonylcarbamoyltransferase complex transferase subunit TsaD [soil metagenome]
MLILGIESSCDETAAAVVRDGRRVLSNRIASQIPIHQRFGGVVPEIASRAHLEQILPMVQEALAEAGATLADLDAVAVTRGPGLIGCLLVGVEFAKSICAARGIPLIAVQHIAGHVYSPYIGREKDAWGVDVSLAAESQPYIALTISGGHSSIVLVDEEHRITTLGETLDDAVGEAYDKVAKLMGLGYPGGPIVDRLAPTGRADAFDFPRPMLHRDGYDFSFSGLKTAVARTVENLAAQGLMKPAEEAGSPVADLCASFQAACIDVLIAKAKRALKEHRLSRLAVVGGVASNRGLRQALAERLTRTTLALPAMEFCTDNAAMIAGAAAPILRAGLTSTNALNATSQLEISAPFAEWQS